MNDYRHEVWCQHLNDSHEAARRISDEYNLHRIAGGYDSIGKWIAAALEDGRSDHVLYDSKYDAVRHQHHNERYYTFIKIGPNSMNPCEAEVMLKMGRQMMERGVQTADREHHAGGMSVIKRLMVEDQLNMLRGVVSNVRMPWEGAK